MNNKQTIKVSENELLEILMNVDRPTFVNVLSETKVRMNKGGNPYYDKVIRVMKGNYFIGGTYEDMVNVSMTKEGMEPTFVSEKNRVGEHVTKCVQFNEKYNRHYLQYFTYPNSIHEVNYVFNENPIQRELFRSYEVKKSQSSRQPQEKKQKPKSLMMSSIKEISLNGTRYIVE